MALETRTKSKKGRDFQYKTNLIDVIVFLEKDDDKIHCKHGEASRTITIYENGELIFIGDKYDLFNQLKKK